MEAAAKEEAARMTERARLWGARRDRLKEFCLRAMQAFGVTRLEGRTGTLIVRGNGGVAPLEITDAGQIDSACCRMVGWVRADLWELALDLVRTHSKRGTRINDFSVERIPENAAIREALAHSCLTCGGEGFIDGGVVGMNLCMACGRTRCLAQDCWSGARI